MNTQADQYNIQPNQNTGMRPTNNQVGGPGEFGSSPAQNGNQNRFDGNSSNNGYSANQQSTQQRQVPPPPVHPSRAGQNNEYSQGQGQNQNVSALSGAGQNQYDQSANQQDQYRNQQPSQGVSRNDQSGGAMRSTEASAGYGAGADNSGYDQNLDQNQPHTLDRRGHRGTGAKAHAAETGAAYEGEKLAHGGHHDGAFNGQQHQNQNRNQNEFGTGPNQDGQFGTQQGQVATGGTAGHHHSGGNAPVRAAEAGAAYEGGKLAHGGHHDGALNGQRHQNQNQNEFGTGPNQGGRFETQQGQGITGGTTGQNHGGQHHGGNAPVRAAEAGAAYEGGKLAHGGHNDGNHFGRQQHNQDQNEFGTGPNQGGQFGTQQGQGITGGTGGQHHAGGNAPVRAAEAGAAYEGGKLAHGGHHNGGHGGQQQHQNQHGFGTGSNQGAGFDNTGAAPNVGQTAGQTQQHPTGVGAGTAATAGGLAGATHPGTGHGTGHGMGAYDQQPGATATTGVPGAHTGATGQTTTAPGTGRGTTAGAGGGIAGPSIAQGQANVIFGKLQQAGGMLLHDDNLRAKGLEREAKGVAKEDTNEATRLEAKAQARREKADGVYSSGGPATANAGVKPTAGTHGRNL
ncbi:hypothetical protein ACEPAG_8687 [Sanghuangporus baumii]